MSDAATPRGRRPLRVAAVDLGATSGRVMVGRLGPGTIELVEAARFQNGAVRRADGLHWDVNGLYDHVVAGLAAARELEPDIASVGVDAWAVDYGLVASGELVGEPFHYRDGRTSAGVETVHALVPFEELYRRNGLQHLPFTTLYQLATERGLHAAETALLVPDLLTWLLSGVEVAERTNASTTGLLDARSGEWDLGLVERLGIPPTLLPRLVDPGAVIGSLSGDAAAAVGAALDVVAVGSHDTASAVVATPLSSPDAAYISCGTWGLVGVEVEEPILTAAAREARFTNERGVDGRVRFLHNVTGLWLLNETVRAWEEADGARIDLAELLAEAADVRGEVPLFDTDHETLAAPGDMPARIAALLGARAPGGRAAIVRSIVESIAAAFADAVRTVGALRGSAVDVIHLVGGGALNTLLCQATADRSGLPVVAGPVEATALGNVLVQARAHGWFGQSATLEVLRATVADSFPTVRFSPDVRAHQEATW